MDARELRRRQIFVLLLFLLIAGGLGGGFFWSLRRAQKESQQPLGGREVAVEQSSFVKPPPPTEGFMGSGVCAECHAEIAAKYARHPMGRSMAEVSEAEPIESYDDTEFAPQGPRRYRVSRTADGVFHHEKMVDAQGETIYDQSVQVRFAVGSGQHGRSYLISKDGWLWQSSIGWFTQGKRWDLSPGYRPEIHQRFERRIGNGCLYCHAGRVNPLGDRAERYAEPVFAEMAIGCERCHGPGQEHVDRQRAARAASPDPTIVNPGRLPPDRREAVCNQCHLQGEKTIPRYGRDFFDFRPGERLDDTLVILVQGERVDQQRKTRPVSQVEQMRASRCYAGAAGKLGCISCHDPHEATEPATEASFYRQRCLECHSERGCSLPEAEQNAPPAGGSCIHCHMPRLTAKDVAHTSLTDHRILRRPERSVVAYGNASHDQLELFDHAAERLPVREIDRVWGIYLTRVASKTHDEIMAARAKGYFCPSEVSDYDIDGLSAALGDDVHALEALGEAFLIMDRNGEAAAVWQRALEIQPRSELLLSSLGDVFQQDKQWSSALKYFDRAIAINPHSSIYHGRRAYILGQLGRLDEGVEAARRALEIDPTLTQVREWLVDVYGRLKRPDEQEEQRKILGRMNSTRGQPGD